MGWVERTKFFIFLSSFSLFSIAQLIILKILLAENDIPHCKHVRPINFEHAHFFLFGLN